MTCVLVPLPPRAGNAGRLVFQKDPEKDDMVVPTCLGVATFVSHCLPFHSISSSEADDRALEKKNFASPTPDDQESQEFLTVQEISAADRGLRGCSTAIPTALLGYLVAWHGSPEILLGFMKA